MQHWPMGRPSIEETLRKLINESQRLDKLEAAVAALTEGVAADRESISSRSAELSRLGALERRMDALERDATDD